MACVFVCMCGEREGETEEGGEKQGREGKFSGAEAIS